jgi:hypothetical protein
MTFITPVATDWYCGERTSTAIAVETAHVNKPRQWATKTITPVRLSTSTSTSTTTTSTATPPPPAPDTKSIGAIAGGVVGGLAVLVLLGLAVFFIVRQRHRRHAADGVPLQQPSAIAAAPPGPVDERSSMLTPMNFHEWQQVPTSPGVGGGVAYDHCKGAPPAPATTARFSTMTVSPSASPPPTYPSQGPVFPQQGMPVFAQQGVPSPMSTQGGPICEADGGYSGGLPHHRGVIQEMAGQPMH